MTITIAGNKKEYDEGVTVEQLIEKENVENPLYVTVTINDDFVDREKFGETVLKDGDAVEFLYFMGGGARYWLLQTNSLRDIPATSSFRRLV